MPTNKTTETKASVPDFISQVESEQKQNDSHRLIDIMREISGSEPVMWGSTIIGFGKYRYKYDSGHGGEAPLIGFSPRKAAISLYVFTGLEKHQSYLAGLGKFKMGKACLYAKKLSDLNEDVLKNLMRQTIEYLQETYGER